MIKRVELFVLIYTLLFSLITPFIYVLGEQRVDAYVAVNILAYFISYTIIRPVPTSSHAVKALNATLLLMFALVVAMRVYEVLLK